MSSMESGLRVEFRVIWVHMHERSSRESFLSINTNLQLPLARKRSRRKGARSDGEDSYKSRV